MGSAAAAAAAASSFLLRLIVPQYLYYLVSRLPSEISMLIATTNRTSNCLQKYLMAKQDQDDSSC
jgi:hypothetical protein